MSFFAELKRRNVIRMGGLYLVGAWLLIQIAETLLPAFDVPGWVLRATIILLAIGFIPALVFSWLFELTAEGIKRDGEVDPSRSIAPQTAEKMNRLTLAGVILLLLVVGADRYWPREVPIAESGGSSSAQTAVGVAREDGLVAVLPFRNRSERKEDAFFAEGIHDDLLTQLSKVASLRVISRTSMMRYQNSEKSVPEIAQELGAAVVLEGAVQRSGDQVRINMQLIDGSSDQHLWAETYDRELTANNLFAIQADIARVVTQALQVVLTPEETAALANGSTDSVEAYEAFLQGKLLATFDRISAERLAQSIEKFDQAIALDPQFSDAYARKARAQLAGYWYAYGEPAWRDAAVTTLQNAQRLAPDSTETWIAEAYNFYWGKLDYASAEKALQRVLLRSPEHVEAWLIRAFIARRDGRMDDSKVALKRVLDIDPVNVEALMDFSFLLSILGDFEAGAALLQQAGRQGADIRFYEIDLALIRGDAEAAWAAVVGEGDGWALDRAFNAAIVSGDRQRIEQSLSTAFWSEADRALPGIPENFALAHAEGLLVSGDREQAERELLAIKARLDALPVPYPGGWNANSLYFPCTLPGLLGDLAGVQAAERDYLENAPRDVFASLDIHLEFANAFARAGDPEKAMTHLETAAEIAGAAYYLRASIQPGLQTLHKHPRWLAFKANYERWATERAK